MQEVLQGRIKARSKDASVASLCPHQGGQRDCGIFFCLLLDPYLCKQEPFQPVSCKIQHHTEIPSTIFPSPHADKQLSLG